MQGKSLLRSAAALVVTAALAAPALAELARWDQARVTKYAGELATAAQDLANAIGALPRPGSQIDATAYHQARDDVRTMQHVARRMARDLGEGADRASVTPSYLRLRALRNSAAEHGRKALIPNDVMDKVAPVGVALIQLAPYFVEEPPPVGTPPAAE